MLSTGYGDMASSYRSTLQTARIRADLERLSLEVSSGQRSDIKTSTGVDIAKFSSIQNTLTTLEAYVTAGQDAAVFAESAQTSLGVIQDQTSTLAPNLISFSVVSVEPGISVMANEARAGLQTVLSALNTRSTDRSLFAGTGVRGLAVADAEVILQDVQAEILAAGATTVADVESVVVDWFDAPGGRFETIGYLGDTSDLASPRLSGSDSVDFGIRADDQEIRDILKGYVMASLVAEGQFSSDVDAQGELMQTAGTIMVNANGGLSNLRSILGEAEEKIQVVITRNEAEISSLEIARNNVVAVDTFEVATELKATELQLQTLYAVTARLSNLSLVNFL